MPNALDRLRAVVERGTEGRVALEFLGESGAFLFHGSPRRLTRLRPRQAKSYDVVTSSDVLHGKPAVSATPYVDVAIYRALVHPSNASAAGAYWSEMDVDSEGRPRFSASADAIAWASRPDTVGWVYVLDPAHFTRFGRIEYRAGDPVRPLARIRVTGLDLPRGIILLPTGYAHRRRPSIDA